MSKHPGWVVVACCALIVGLCATLGFQISSSPGVTGGGGIASYVQINSGVAGSIAALTQNNAKGWAFIPPLTVTTSNFTYNVQTADNTANTYDLGLFDANCNLLTHTGLTAGTTLFPSGGIKSVAWLSTVTLNQGSRYYFGWSTAAAAPTAVINGTAMLTPAGNAAMPAPAAGVLQSGACPADSYSNTVTPTFVLR